MKNLIRILFVAVLFSSLSFMASAQKKSGKLEVKTQLTEAKGTYVQRKLYREFLTSYMQKCPYISNFSIHEAIGDADNHKVVWDYAVNSWSDITKFYHWVSQHIESDNKSGLVKAMAPYAPDYNIGGKISVSEINKAALAKR